MGNMGNNLGLLTFHFADNYGALLQTYSLFRKLTQYNEEVEIINFCPSEHSRGLYFIKCTNIKSIVTNLLRLFYLGKWLKRRASFLNFRNSFLKMSPKYEDIDSIDFGRYGTLITGSDQTFNLKYPFTEVYYLPFTKRMGQKKIAYAPSFGSMCVADLDSKHIELLNNFDYISCREEAAAEKLTERLGREVSFVLDPVFLTSKEDWELMIDDDYLDDSYVFIYDLNGRFEIFNIAMNLFPNSRFIAFSNDILFPLKFIKSNVIFIQDLTVTDFLKYIHKAKAVVTDSFHGTAFSIIFQKEFYVYISLEAASDRIKSLLTALNLSDRIITSQSHTETEIDYNGVNRLLKSMISESEQFIDNALNEK